MFCPKCGKELPRYTQFCDQCGVAQVPSHLVMAILTTIFCCQPFGVVSIVYAVQVSTLLAVGNVEAAVKASNNAQKWALIALVAGACFYMLMIVRAAFMVIR